MPLNEIQEKELRKAFMLADTDGNNSLDVNEVKHLLAQLKHHSTNIFIQPPSDQEVFQLMKLLDENGDGQVEWEEFKHAMEKWMDEDKSSTSRGSSSGRAVMNDNSELKKRKQRDYSVEREQVHDKVQKFFLQFRVRDPAMNSPSSPQMTSSLSKRKGIHDHHYRDSLFSVGMSGVVSQDEHLLKAQSISLNNLKSQLLEFPKLPFIIDLHSKNIQHSNVLAEVAMSKQQLDIVYNQIKNVLAQCIVFCDLFVIHYSTPYDRIEISDMILDTYQHIFDECFSVFNLLLDMSIYYKLYDIQHQVLYIFNCICNGPRIANLDQNHKYHLQNMYFKKLIAEYDILNKVYQQILKQPMTPMEISKQSISLIARFASFNKECRDKIYEINGLLPDLLKTLGGVLSKYKIGLLKIITFALAILMGDLTHTQSSTVKPTTESTFIALNLLSQLLFHWRVQFEDQDTLVYILHALIGILNGVRQDDLFKKFVDLLNDKNQYVVESVLSIVISKLIQDKFNVYILVEKCQLLETFKKVFTTTSSNMVRYYIMLCVTDTVKTYPFSIMKLDRLNLISDLIAELEKDTEFNDKIIRCLRHICKHMPMSMLLKYLDGYNFIHSLIRYCLNHYYTPKDDVLEKFYNNSKASSSIGGSTSNSLNSYNFELIYHTVHCLLSIIHNHNGELLANIENGSSLYTPVNANQIAIYQTNCLSKFTFEDIADIGTLLKGIVQSPLRESINNWKYSDQQQRSLEEYVRVLLVYIKTICDKINGNVFLREMSQKVQLLIEQILQQSYAQIELQTNPILEAYKTLYSKQKDRVLQLTRVLNSMITHDQSKVTDDLYYKTLTISSKSLVDLENEEKELKYRTFQQLLATCNNLNTQISDDTLEKLLEYFTSICDKNTGLLSKDQFIEGMMNILNIRDRLLIENNYQLFDIDNSGKIDFREFVVGIVVVNNEIAKNAAATLTDREKVVLYQLFSVYDLNKDNMITFDELLQMRRSGQMEGMNKAILTEEELIQDTKAVFEKIDADHNGIIDFNEFVHAVKSGILNL
ncbi:hypothetical protein FDP41_010817 [Naegleria fowleri]|uniref:EF-hand domain-containing protein n=1 Tax=Naegleria fowleri TaxID=5763 RepID=A0A6A5CB26_NAEFO|nr:uncharacterized protein FDP41_010817 [Naegleria fowleri]KAF0982838.1 hypothetical protein FDP41_010817 [Naegleria fowleri]CAG4719293.1 unnamed protein product [Naegleria fowleri]